jgi:hypothetical protein
MATKRTTITKTFDEATIASRREALRQRERARRLRYPSAWLDPNYYADPANSYPARYLISQAATSQDVAGTWYRLQIANAASMLTPEMESTVQRYLDRGVVSPQVAAGLADVGRTIHLDDDTLNAIATLDATAATMAADQAQPTQQGSEAQKGQLARQLGEVSRPLFALMSMPFEAVYGTLRNVVGGAIEAGAQGGFEALVDPEVDPWEQSLGGQYIRGLIDPNLSSDLGDGWFPAGEVHARQVAAARSAAPLVHGRAWTPGRGVTSLFIEDPDSRTYRNVSGLIDLISNVVLDPLVILGGSGTAIRGAQGGARTAAGLRISETAKAAAAEEALTKPAAWLAPRETIRIAADHVKSATQEFTNAQRANGQYMAVERLGTAEDRYQRIVDAMALANDDALVGVQKVSTRAGRETAVGLSDAEIAERVRSATENLQDGLGALAARVSDEAPDLPGIFTRELPAQESSLIGTLDGTDAIITSTKSNLSTVSVDDVIDNLDQYRDLVRGLKAPKAAKQRALETLNRQITRPGQDPRPIRTFGDLLETAAKDRTGGTIAAALRANGTDAVTDVFRLTDRERGVWWVGRDVDVVRHGMDGAWEHVDRTLPATQQRLRSLQREQRSAAGQRARAKRDAEVARRTATALADQYDQVMTGRLDLADAESAVNAAVEYSLGVRRRLGGRPEVNHQAIKDFITGKLTDFDAAVGTGLKPGQKAVVAADRALLGAVTLGGSEVLRAAKRLTMTPVLAKARERVLADLVRLSDTPENLGRLHRLTRGKIDAGALRAALRAEDEDGVLEALAPNMGVQITRPITPGIVDLGRSRLTEVRTGRSNNHLFNRGISWIIDEAEQMGTIAPRGLVALNFADPLGSARDLRNYLANIPHLDNRTVDGILGEYLSAANETGRARSVMAGFDRVYDALVDYHAGLAGLSDETRDALNEALRRSTRLFDGGRAKVNDWWTRRYVADAKPSVVTMNGEVVPLPGPQLEAELARGGLVLPDMQNLRDSIGRWGKFIGSRKDKLVSPENIRDVVSAANDFWRSSVLLRPAYVLRNVGEMQSRMFLTGHSSIFNHPLGTIAFAMATGAKHEAVRNLAQRFTRANMTATGHTFTKFGLDDAKAVDEAVQIFAETAIHQGSRLDMRTHRAAQAFHGLEEVGISQPGFSLGLAEQLLMLNASRLGRILAGNYPDEVARAVNRGADSQEAIVNWLLSAKDAHPIRQMFADNDYSFSRIFGNPRLGIPGDQEALRQFLFTAEGAVAKRLEYFTRGSDELRGFVATGVLSREGGERFTMGINARDGSSYAEAMAVRGRKLARELKPFVDKWRSQNPDTMLFMRVLRSGRNEQPFQLFDSVFDSFFNWAGRMENAWAVGPEFAYAYHQKLAQLLPAVRIADRQQVFDVIKGAEGRLRSLSETMRSARIGLKASDEGMLTVDDVSAMAARQASEHVKTFFYDAMRRNQFFHALRVVWPFAQSFVDTLHRWGSLVAQRPYMIEKVGRLGMGLTDPGSSIIYDDFDYIDPLTDRTSYDPNQGFLWFDPDTGEQMLTFPLVGSALGAALSPVAGMMIGENVDLASAMQLSAPLRNLNIALQGDVDYLPGVGPMFSVPANVFMPDDSFGAVPEWLRSYVFPYGRPKYEGGLIESIAFPTWLRRLLGAGWSQEWRAYSVKGSMAYLLSTQEYPNFRSDPGMAQQVVEDTDTMARFMAFIRAFGAFALPAAPEQDIFAADADGNMIATAYIADRWHNLLDGSGRDTEAATAALAETYGLETLAAVAGPSTEGSSVSGSDVPFSGAAWEFFKQNPQRGKAYADVLGYFFPGDYSYEANQWVNETSRRRKLSTAERTGNVLEFLYFAERRMLEGRAAREGWDTGAIRQAEDELDEMYGEVTPTFEVGRIEREIAKVRRALNLFPELAATRAGEGTELLLEAYDSHVEEARERWGSGATLKAKRSAQLRDSFLAEVDLIVEQYGGYNLQTGSVDTIAGMFARLVEPEE